MASIKVAGSVCCLRLTICFEAKTGGISGFLCVANNYKIKQGPEDSKPNVGVKP